MNKHPPIEYNDLGKFYCLPDGQKLPSITTVLGGIKSTPDYALLNWRKSQIAQGLDPNAAANRGTRLHKLAEQWINGERLEIPEDLANWWPSLKAGLESVFAAYGWPIAVEQYVQGSWFAGMLDVLIQGSDRYILDIKTTVNVNSWRSKDKTIQQLSGYAVAGNLRNTNGIILLANPEEYRIINVPLDHDKAVLEWEEKEKLWETKLLERQARIEAEISRIKEELEASKVLETFDFFGG